MSSYVTDHNADQPEETEPTPDGPEDTAAASEPEASDAMGGYAKGGEAPLDAQTDEGSQEPEEKS